MSNNADNLQQALMPCSGWEFQRFVDGPLAQLLMHVVTDAAGLLRGDAASTARANARLVVRDGAIFGVVAKAPRSAMRDVLLAAGAALVGQRYDESAFGDLNALLASTLLAAGHPRAQVTLEHHATALPRPLLTAVQVGRLALGALNTARRQRGEPALSDLAAGLADHVVRAGSFDDPAVHAYRAALDPNAVAYLQSARAERGVQALRAVREVNGIALDRLAVYNFIGASPASSRNRVQAMQALPWLLAMMTAPGNGPILVEAVGICHAIDNGLPLHEAVARAFGVPREVVRWLGRRALPGNWAMDAGRLRRLLALLAWVAPERRPQQAAQFDALTALGSALAAPLGFHGGEEDPALLARYAPCMRRWLAEVTRCGLEGATAAPEFAQLTSELADAKDFLRALFEAVQVADGLDHGAAEACVLRWCAGIEAARLLTLSRAWHAAIAAATGDAAGDNAGSNAGLGWPAVLLLPWQYEQRTVVELISSAQLRTEGQTMLHCVGSYDEVCRSGNSVIVSLRAPSGMPVSTAELHLGQGGSGVVAGQHRAARNAIPGADCACALVAFVAYLNGADHGELLRRRQDFQRQRAVQRRSLQGNGKGGQGVFSAAAQQAARRLALQPPVGLNGAPEAAL